MVLSSALASAMLLVLGTCSDAYLIRNIVPREKSLNDLWYNVFQLNMVTTNRLQTSTAENSIGMDAVLAAVDHDSFEIGDCTGPEKIQQLSVTNFKHLLNTADINEFSSLLKQMAAKRRRIQESDRPALSRAVLERLDQLNDELFSDCIWSIGTLRCNVNDFSAISSTIQGKDVISYFWENVARVSETANRLCLTRLAIGLGKMGLRWDNLPASTRVGLIKLIQNGNFPGDVGILPNAIPESKELATILFTLGQLGVTTDLLPEGSLARVLEEVAQIAVNFTPQVLSNALHGLARMGVLWADLPLQAQTELPKRGAAIVAEMRSDELCSIMQSMAVMKIQWSTLPSSFRSELLAALEVTLPTLNNRELSNVFWSLGKTNVSFKDDLSPLFVRVLMDSLVSGSRYLKPFDVESIFVGLGLMQVDFNSLTDDTQEYIVQCVERHLSSMNIFCMYNVLWGLARMGATTSYLGPTLSAAVLEKTVCVLHTFLPTQYGDVIWSLGTLGYSKADLSPVMSDRLLAVLSRVYGKLHVRAAAYTLWGLSKMGFQWDDMRVRTRSLAGGREADPLSDSVNKYLRQRVASMKEHEYSVLLYSLGGLRAQIQGDSEQALPSYVTDKIHHRATRVSTFLTSRSLANSLYGLGKCGVRWMKLPEETRDAWQAAMLRPASVPVVPSQTPSPGTVKSRDSGVDRRGLAGMRTLEFSQTLYGMGQMQVPWRSLSYNARDAIVREVELLGRVGTMDLHGVSSGLWGLAAMGCLVDEVPPTLLAAARSRLWAPADSAVSKSAAETVMSATQMCDATADLRNFLTVEISSESIVENLGSITETGFKELYQGQGQGQEVTKPVRREVLTSLGEAALSLSMGLDAMGRLKVVLSAQEMSAVCIRLHTLAPHMGPDSIVSCTGGLSQLGALWSDLTPETRYIWISTLKKPTRELTVSKRQALAESLSKMRAL